ncbi:hypothetical protein L484_019223 [Morus notabilis]|uniref:Uncharacterized protein n=1 Tax=Morus notabilis TaxID=981085 RepID=W9QYS5_9ROSA|nr:hypothetical protein L484_019223 [Morus notabilis]
MEHSHNRSGWNMNNFSIGAFGMNGHRDRFIIRAARFGGLTRLWSNVGWLNIRCSGKVSWSQNHGEDLVGLKEAFLEWISSKVTMRNLARVRFFNNHHFWRPNSRAEISR